VLHQPLFTHNGILHSTYRKVTQQASRCIPTCTN